MTRIIGGTYGGRRLHTPSGSSTRPTADRVREALFSALEVHLGTWRGRAVLDLFAGSGAVGLEAASRGASHVVLVDSDRRAVATIRRNVEELGVRGVTVVARPAAKVLSAGPVDAERPRTAAPPTGPVDAPRPRTAAPPAGPVDAQGVATGLVGSFDVVYLDPPYPLPSADLVAVLGLLGTHGWLAPHAVVVVERAARDPEPEWPEGWSRERSRVYGETVLWWLAAHPSEEEAHPSAQEG